MNVPRIGTSELIDLLLSLIVLTIAFSMSGRLGGGIGIPSASILVVSAVAVGSGFLLHELAHKFVAQRYGYWAEYKASPMGLILTLVMALVIGIVFAAPGAVMIRKGGSSSTNSYSPDSDAYWDQLERKAGGEELWIALAGPITNIILAAFFFSLSRSGLVLGDFLLPNLLWYAMYINLILAAFNMIPFDPLDGAKIFRGNALIWAIVGVPTILFTLAVFTGIV